MDKIIYKKVYDFEEYMEYNLENKEEIVTNTFLRIANHWGKHKKVAEIDVYKFTFKYDSDYKFMYITVYPFEWLFILEGSLELFLQIQEYNLAARNRDILNEVREFINNNN